MRNPSPPNTRHDPKAEYDMNWELYLNRIKGRVNPRNPRGRSRDIMRHDALMKLSGKGR
jgi:hypothetical protein